VGGRSCIEVEVPFVGSGDRSCIEVGVPLVAAADRSCKEGVFEVPAKFGELACECALFLAIVIGDLETIGANFLPTVLELFSN
jgi:hypothetical protein